MSMQPDPDMNPGDEAEPGTPGAGEDVCEICAGSGKQADGKPCVNCGGSGHVMRGLVTRIHAFAQRKTWMAGTSPAMTTKDVADLLRRRNPMCRSRRRRRVTIPAFRPPA